MNPDSMLGASDQFPGSDYAEPAVCRLPPDRFEIVPIQWMRDHGVPIVLLWKCVLGLGYSWSSLPEDHRKRQGVFKLEENHHGWIFAAPLGTIDEARFDIRAERDKLLKFYTEIVIVLGDDLVLKRFADLERKVADLQKSLDAEVKKKRPWSDALAGRVIDGQVKENERVSERCRATLCERNAALDTLRYIKLVALTAKDGPLALSHITRACFDAGVTGKLPELFPDAKKDQGCRLAKPGWICTRAPGHDGPCAALPLPGAPKVVTKEVEGSA